MDLEQADLEYFIRFVLLDHAWRPTSGKRQTQAMKGFWMSWLREQRMRGSDARSRRSVCIEALRTIGGLSVAKAASEVATVLKESTANEVEAIRTNFYERGSDKASRDMFFSQFLSWREWV